MILKNVLVEVVKKVIIETVKDNVKNVQNIVILVMIQVMVQMVNVMIQRQYLVFKKDVKLDIRTAAQEEKTMERVLLEGEGQLEQLLINQLQGLSPFTARELLFRAELEPRATYGDLTTEEKDRLHQELRSFLDEMEEARRLASCLVFSINSSSCTLWKSSVGA